MYMYSVINFNLFLFCIKKGIVVKEKLSKFIIFSIYVFVLIDYNIL